jgi:anti-anti-sigma factor
MKIERAVTDDGPVFRLVGRLEGGAARQLQRVLSGPASDGGVVTVDLTDLEMCDAGGASVFVTLSKRARLASGGLVLSSPSESVLRVLTETTSQDALCIVQTEGAAAADKSAPRDHPKEDTTMRYLFRADEDEPFAYAPGRRDFYLVSDDSLWAHESHDWLLAAGSGAVIAHRTNDSYFGVDDGERLYCTAPAHVATSG